MTIHVEAVYENGVLKPTHPLPLKEHERVQITVEPKSNWVQETSGILRGCDPQVVEWAAMDAELEYPPAPEEQ